MIPSVFAAAFIIFPAIQAPDRFADHRLDRDAGSDHRPTVGGYLSHSFSWHWLFLVNVPPGIIVTIAAWTLIDFDKPEPGLPAISTGPALISMGVFLGALEYVLEEGNNKGWLEDEKLLSAWLRSLLQA